MKHTLEGVKGFFKQSVGFLCFLLVTLTVFVAGFVQVAWAQDVTEPTFGIDFGPLLREYLIPLLGVVLVVLLKIAVSKANKWLEAKTGNENLDLDLKFNSYLHAATDRAVQYALERVDNVDWTKIETRNALVATASNYLIKNSPKALEYFGIDASPEALEQLILSKLGKYDKVPGTWTGESPPVAAPTT